MKKIRHCFLPPTECHFRTYSPTQHALTLINYNILQYNLLRLFCTATYSALSIFTQTTAHVVWTLRQITSSSIVVFVPHFIIVYRATGYALYHFTGGSSIISSISHFTINYQTAGYSIRTQRFYCISPMGAEVPCQFTSTLWLRLQQRRPLCTLLYCTYTPILTSHTHIPLGFSSALLNQNLCSLLASRGTEPFS